MKNFLEQEKIKTNVRKICDNWRVMIAIDDFEIYEDFKNKKTKIKSNTLQILSKTKKEKLNIEGEGKGVVDAFFQAFLNATQTQYPSLSDIKFEEFSVKAILNNKIPGSDSNVEVTIRLSNSRKEMFEFRKKSHSINSASIKVIIRAFEFFINSHIAITKIYISLKDAKDRNRLDLIEKYTKQMSELVRVTNYSPTIESLKK